MKLNISKFINYIKHITINIKQREINRVYINKLDEMK